jgi:hypothetical protein
MPSVQQPAKQWPRFPLASFPLSVRQLPYPRLTGLPRGEWMAPHEKMDWTGKSARETCLIAKKTWVPATSTSLLLEHLLHDERVHWALDNGMTPNGKFPAVPGGSKEWARDVRAWAEGTACSASKANGPLVKTT